MRRLAKCANHWNKGNLKHTGWPSVKTVVEHRLWVALKPFFLHCVGKLLGLRGVLIALHRLESSSRRETTSAELHFVSWLVQ
jgi:hypothetical protein